MSVFADRLFFDRTSGIHDESRGRDRASTVID